MPILCSRGKGDFWLFLMGSSGTEYTWSHTVTTPQADDLWWGNNYIALCVIKQRDWLPLWLQTLTGVINLYTFKLCQSTE